jgi:hypothetical protein
MTRITPAVALSLTALTLSFFAAVSVVGAFVLGWQEAFQFAVGLGLVALFVVLTAVVLHFHALKLSATVQHPAASDNNE